MLLHLFLYFYIITTSLGICAYSKLALSCYSFFLLNTQAHTLTLTMSLWLGVLQVSRHSAEASTLPFSSSGNFMSHSLLQHLTFDCQAWFNLEVSHSFPLCRLEVRYWLEQWHPGTICSSMSWCNWDPEVKTGSLLSWAGFEQVSYFWVSGFFISEIRSLFKWSLSPFPVFQTLIY